MSDPIFVKVRNDKGELYDSYTDYWRLIHLSGFDSIELNDVGSYADRTLIFAPDNGNVRESLNALRDRHSSFKAILWQLERPGKIGDSCPDYFDEMLVSDRYFHEHWFPLQPKVKYVPMGGHVALGETPSLSKEWDFVHLSYLYGLREAKARALQEMGFTMAPNGWGEARDYSLAHSKFGLCLHQDEIPVIEPLRFTLFACWQLPLITDVSMDYYPYHVTPLDDIAQFVNFDKLEAFAPTVDANYKLLTEELTFEKCVKGALYG